MKVAKLINASIIIFLIGVLCVVSGCTSSRKITMKPDKNLFDVSKRVKVDVYSRGAHKEVDSSIIRRLSASVKEELRDEGFIVTESEDSIRLKVNVKYFDSGNQALRILITFGPGGASLNYRALYFDQNGDQLADVYDNVHLSGWDPNLDHLAAYSAGEAIFGGSESITEGIIDIAAERIVNIALNDFE